MRRAVHNLRVIPARQSLVPHLGLTPHRISLRHVLGFCEVPLKGE